MSERPQRRKRVLRTATVVRTEQLTTELVRVIVTGDDLVELPELTLTDHYIKLVFAPAGAAYAWPFDPEAVKESEPREFWPVTRTYTIRSFNRASNEMAIDFVVHGDEGLAGPWAQAAQPGDTIGFFGPGGAWAPDPAADVHLLVGDEAAAPAIAAALDVLPDGSRAQVFLEVSGANAHIPLPERDGVEVTWVYRDPSSDYGIALAEAVRAAGVPSGEWRAFVHGNANMIKDLRRWFFVEQALPRDNVHISGYWRTGQTEDGWQAGKAQFNEQMDAEERAATS